MSQDWSFLDDARAEARRRASGERTRSLRPLLESEPGDVTRRQRERREGTAELECLDQGPDCSGPVEYRMPLSGTGRAFPRCELHWEQRLERQERITRDYPDSPSPPSWFDPAAAGERWDEDY